MPVGELLPSFVVVGILQTIINNGSAAEDADVLNVEKIERAVDPRAGFEVDSVAGFWIEAFAVNSGGDDADIFIRCCGRWGGRGSVEEVEHHGVIEKIAGL